jgi:uncharacterized protein HemY
MAIVAADRQAFRAAYQAARAEVDSFFDVTAQDIEDLRLGNGIQQHCRHMIAVARALRAIDLVRTEP